MNKQTMLLQVILGIGLLLVVLSGVTSNQLFRTLGTAVIGISLVLFIVKWLLSRR